MESNITFQDLGLSEAMLKALEKKGYGWPTTIQAEAIPHFMQWRDVIAKAKDMGLAMVVESEGLQPTGIEEVARCARFLKAEG